MQQTPKRLERAYGNLLAKRAEPGYRNSRNLLGTRRHRELVQAAKDIAADTGLEHRPVTEGLRVVGIYRCFVAEETPTRRVNLMHESVISRKRSCFYTHMRTIIVCGV